MEETSKRNPSCKTCIFINIKNILPCNLIFAINCAFKKKTNKLSIFSKFQIGSVRCAFKIYTFKKVSFQSKVRKNTLFRLLSRAIGIIFNRLKQSF